MRILPGTEAIEPPRPLTIEEQAALRHVLGADFRGAERLRGQVEHARVSGRCLCGCPTVDFVVDRGAARAAQGLVESENDDTAVVPRSDEPPWILVSEARLKGADPPQEVLLFASVAGWLASLELVTYSDRPPDHFPPAGELSDPIVHARLR